MAILWGKSHEIWQQNEGAAAERRALCLAMAADAEVLATFADGKPAVTLARPGRGAVLRFALMPGLGYLKSAKEIPSSNVITGFDPAQLPVLTAGIKVAGVVSPLTVSERLVEARRGPKADVIALANRSGREIAELRIEVRASGIGQVQSNAGSPVKVTHTRSGVVITCALREADLLILRRGLGR